MTGHMSVLGTSESFMHHPANDFCWPILLKNSKIMRVDFSAENQSILNSSQNLIRNLTSSSGGQDR